MSGRKHGTTDSYHDYTRDVLIAIEYKKLQLPMHNDHAIVDDLIAEIADSNSSYQEVAAETLKRLCLQSCEAYDHLEGRIFDLGLPQHTQKRLGDVLATVRAQTYTCQECEQACEISSRHGDDVLSYVLHHHSVQKIC